MTKQLTTQNATITTAAVEVKTLTISGKQVTLAVFRQLREEPLVDELDAAIAGAPWGTVNYHPDKCGDAPEHVHVVWQKGSDLRRATVRAPHAGGHRHFAADLYVRARILKGDVHNPWNDPRPGDTLRLGERISSNQWRQFGCGHFAHDGIRYEGHTEPSLLQAWRKGDRPTSDHRRSLEEDAYAISVSGASLGEIEQNLLSMLPTAEYRKSWAELSSLPQLFIAV